MERSLIIIIVIIVLVGLFFIYKRFTNRKESIQSASKVKLDQLEGLLDQLKSKRLEHDFFGITTNGIDCIYFVESNGQIDIEFEVMMNEQKPYVNKLKNFASENGFRLTETTYGNKPDYDDLLQAPVYKLEINADVKTAAGIGKKVMVTIFNCDEEKMLEVVP